MHQINNALMPKHYFPDDAKWIQELAITLSPSSRHKALASYSNVYQELWESEPVSYRKDNTARHEANKRLREYVRLFHKAMQGYTAKPKAVSQ